MPRDVDDAAEALFTWLTERLPGAGRIFVDPILRHGNPKVLFKCIRFGQPGQVTVMLDRASSADNRSLRERTLEIVRAMPQEQFAVLEPAQSTVPGGNQCAE